MLRRVSRLSKRISSRDGFTLVEMVVVMGILSFLMILVFSGFTVARQENYINYVANTFQTQMRQAFVDAVSTKKISDPGGVCDGRSTVIKMIKLQLGTSIDTSATPAPLSVTPFCDTGASTPTQGTTTPLDPSTSVNFKQNLKVTASNASDGISGTLYLFFTSPYGKFYAMSSPSDWSKDQSTQIWSPTNSLNLGQVTITFADPNGGSSHQVVISPAGSAELK